MGQLWSAYTVPPNSGACDQLKLSSICVCECVCVQAYKCELDFRKCIIVNVTFFFFFFLFGIKFRLFADTLLLPNVARAHVEFTSDEIHHIWSRACKVTPDFPFSLIPLRWKIGDFNRMITGITPFARTGEVSLFVRRPVVDKAGRYGRLIQFPQIPAPAISWDDHFLWKDGTIFSLWV